MKKNLASPSLAVLLLCLSMVFSDLFAQSAPSFYYYFDQKINLSEVPGTAVVVFSEGQESDAAQLLNAPGFGLTKPVQHSPLHACRYQVKSQASAELKDLRERLRADARIHNVLPVYRTDEGDEVLVTDRVILRAKDPAWETALLHQCTDLGLELTETIYVGGGTDFYVFKTPRFANPLDLGNRVQETGLATFAHASLSRECRSHHTPNDTQHGSQWFLHQSNDRDIDAREAWDITKGSSSVVVAVVDGNGYELNHEDMTGKFVSPYDAVNNDNDPSPENQYANHGVSCAGLVGAATNNSKGVSGVGYGVKVLPIVIGYNANSNGNFSTNSTIMARAAQRIVQTAGVVAVSNSWGGDGYDAAEEQAFTSMRTNSRSGKGAVVLASTGNNGQNVSKRPVSYVGIIGVGNSNESDTRTSSSNYGNTLEVMAPGNNTLTTDRSGSNGYESSNYTYFGGTSAACPVAAGVVGLIASVNPNLTGVQLSDILQTTTDKVGGYSYTNNSSKPLGTWNIEMGYGRVNAYNAVRRAAKPTLTVSAISGGSATASWNAIAGATNYSLRYKLASASTWTTLTVSGTSRSIAGLSASSSYQAQVVANFGSTSVQGEWSDVRTFGSGGGGGGGTCAVPSGLTALSITQTTATLDWADVSGATSYQVRIRVSGSSTWTDLGSVTSSAMNIINMTAGTSYEWQVRTLCSGSTTSNYSATATFTAQQASAPYNNNPCYAYILTPYNFQSWVSGTTTGATATYSGSTCGTSNPRDVWYACQIPSSGVVTFRTSAGSLDDAMMAVYWGSCSNMTYIICEDDNYNGDAMPAIGIQGQPGTWLYIRVWGYENASGTFGICALNYNTGDSGEPTDPNVKIYSLPPHTDGEGPEVQLPRQAPDQPEYLAAADRSDADLLEAAQVGLIFPNPTTGLTQLPFALREPSEVRLQVIDAVGRLVFEQVTEWPAGEHTHALDLSQLAAGAYLVRFQSGGAARVQRVEVQH